MLPTQPQLQTNSPKIGDNRLLNKWTLLSFLLTHQLISNRMGRWAIDLSISIHEQRLNILPKFMPISFSSVYLVFKVFQDIWGSDKENPGASWSATLSCPQWSQMMQIRISFRSRSDLVLDADHALDFLSYLVFLACISFRSVSDRRGASLFLLCSHTNAVAHM